MAFTPGTTASVAAFLAIVAIVVVAFVYAVHSSARSSTKTFVIGLAAWLGAFALVVSSGAIGARPLPLVPIVFAIVNLAAIVFALSRTGRAIGEMMPLRWLVAFQAFRFPLELVLHSWSESGTIPTTMTWTGSNLDIVSGLVALVAIPFAERRAVAWLANLVGLALLVNVARVALMSSPLPFAWDVQPKLTLLAHLPYAFIGPVCVAGALAGHVILTRRLVATSSLSSTGTADARHEA